MTDYAGPERRRENLDWSDRLGRWLLEHASAWGVFVLLHFVILSLIAAGVLLIQRNSTDQIEKLKRTSEDTRQVATFLQDCLLQKAKLTPAEQAQRCVPDNTGQVVRGLVVYMNCAFLVPPAERTEAILTACAARGFGQ